VRGKTNLKQGRVEKMAQKFCRGSAMDFGDSRVSQFPGYLCHPSFPSPPSFSEISILTPSSFYFRFLLTKKNIDKIDLLIHNYIFFVLYLR
jgi:hypothetical protein